MVLLTTISTEKAWSACTPSNTGTAGADVITCNTANDPAGTAVNSLAGNDTINFEVGATTVDISSGDDNDTLNLTGGTVTDTVDAGNGNDIVNLNGTIVTNSVDGQDGEDILNIISGSANVVSGGDDNDLFTMTGGTIENARGGDGVDTFSLTGGTINVGVTGDGGNDVITLDGADVNFSIRGDAGDDEINIISGTVDGSVSLGADNDVFTMTGGDINVTVFGNDGDDEINLVDGNIDANIRGGDGEDQINLTGGTVGINVRGEGDNDTIILNGSTIDGEILGEAGSDIMTLISGSADTIEGGDGDDEITLRGATIEDSINAGDGDDELVWSSGTVVSTINAGDGADTLLLTASEYDGSQVLDGGDDVSLGDGWTDTLTLQGISLALTGANISNWENFTVDGGEVSFTDDALTVGSDAGTGLTISNNGVVSGGSAFALTGNMTIDVGSQFQGFGSGVGNYTTSGSVINNGSVTTQDNVVGDVVTIAGDYSGTGTLLFDTDFTSDASDTLNVGGDVTSTGNPVTINDVSSSTESSGNAITLITVTGATADGDFTLVGGPITSGIFSYDLGRSGQNWLLSRATLNTIPVFESYPQILKALNTLPTLQQRVGNRYWINEKDYDIDDTYTNTQNKDYSPIWADIEALRTYQKPSFSTTNSEYDISQWKFRSGIDFLLSENDNGRYIGGVNLFYGTSSASITSGIGNGSINSDGYGIGVSTTWYGLNGVYVDGQAQITKFSSELNAGGSKVDNDGKGHVFSVEFGKRFDISDNNLTATPQFQLSYSSVDFDSFAGPNGEIVSLDYGKSIVGRLGVSVDKERSWKNEDGGLRKSHIYGITNLYREFTGSAKVDISGTDLVSKKESWTGEIGFGGSLDLVTDEKSKTSIYGEVSASASIEDIEENKSYKATGGIRHKF